jgi:hypothetical protein
MPIPIYRAFELYNHPAKGGRPAKRGLFGVGKSFFYEVIEPLLERVNLGPKAIAYTGRSVDKVIEEGIAKAIASATAAPSILTATPIPTQPETVSTPHGGERPAIKRADTSTRRQAHSKEARPR